MLMDKMNFVCFMGKADIIVGSFNICYETIYAIIVSDDPTIFIILSGISITIFLIETKIIESKQKKQFN